MSSTGVIFYLFKFIKGNAFLKENGMAKVDFIRDEYEALRTKKKDN